ncbi:phage protein NinX family protein [Vibrio agarivorans]|uniref:phage protein NinX family protein n=1 Tax=Vibrio agarivorans TaxID=153622 RepID=UPI0025B50F60|nr:phage protein NinX family protein [Vibrio agarivorans]MDN3661119.1 DUF2591 family protein [Vibrio agarivorans]
MLTVCTSSLQGIALDWAVAKALELPIVLDPMGFNKDAPDCAQSGFWVWEDDYKLGRRMLIGIDFSPSSHWYQGGEIFEQFQIGVVPSQGEWSAHLNNGECRQRGATVLIAAMRSFVMSSLGERLEIPKELVSKQLHTNSQQEQDNA